MPLFETSITTLGLSDGTPVEKRWNLNSPSTPLTAIAAWNDIGGGPSSAGEIVTEKNALCISTVYILISTDGTIGGSGAALAQQTLFYVYYGDPTYVGGNVKPIATTNKADFIGKLGYFEIDSVVTPYAATTGAGGSTGSLYYPTTYADFGTRSTLLPSQAIDGDLSTFATVSGSFTQRTSGVTPVSPDGVSAEASASPVTTPTATDGDCTWSGLPSMSFTTSSTLTVIAAATVFSSGLLTVTASVGGTIATMASLTATTAQATYTLPISAGVDLSTSSMECAASSESATGTSATCSLLVYEIYVQS